MVGYSRKLIILSMAQIFQLSELFIIIRLLLISWHRNFIHILIFVLVNIFIKAVIDL